MYNHAADNANAIFHTQSMRNSTHLVELKSRAQDRRYNVVSSCNGLLCLSEQLDDEPLEKDNVVVCNPVTGEFTYIPESCHNGKHFGVGFGFCPKKNEYKVVRISLLAR